MMGLIKKYLLPEEINFNEALLQQAQCSTLLIDILYEASISNSHDILQAISIQAKKSAQLKTKNMSQLLSVFITPYDKESIYRMITQLDWISLSVKHFHLEAEAYDLSSLGDYRDILKIILDMAKALEEGVSLLPEKELVPINTRINGIYQQYDQVVKACAHASAALLEQDDIKRIIRHKDMLLQLKEISRRIYITATILEDMAIKIL